MEEETKLRQLGAALADLSQAVNEQDTPPIVTRFYCIAETIDVDGLQGIEAFYTDGLSVWDRIGMLEFELQVERLKIQPAT